MNDATKEDWVRFALARQVGIKEILEQLNYEQQEDLFHLVQQAYTEGYCTASSIYQES